MRIFRTSNVANSFRFACLHLQGGTGVVSGPGDPLQMFDGDAFLQASGQPGQRRSISHGVAYQL